MQNITCLSSSLVPRHASPHLLLPSSSCWWSMLPQMQPSLAAGISRTLHMQHATKAVASEGTQIIDDSECAAANPNSTQNPTYVIPLITLCRCYKQMHNKWHLPSSKPSLSSLLRTSPLPLLSFLPHLHSSPTPLSSPPITTPPHLTPDPLSLSVSPVRRLQATPSSPPHSWHIECTTSALTHC